MAWTATHSWAYKEAPSSTVFNAQLRDNMDYLKTAVETATPTGTVTMFGGAVAPTGYLFCNGAAISRSTYATLFAIIGVAYGNGNNSTTFNLPNLGGRFPGGKTVDNVLGETGGESQHTLTANEMPAHTHTVRKRTNALTVAAVGFCESYETTNRDFETGSAGGGASHNTLPPYQVVNFIIKY